MSRRNRVRAMMAKPYANAAKVGNDPAGLKNMGKGFMNAMKTMRNTAGQKLRNVGQTLKNKYNVMKTEATLENDFYYRPNVAGKNFSHSTNARKLERGYGTRNLLNQANRQHKYMEERKRRKEEYNRRRRETEEQEKAQKNSELYTKATVARNLGGLFF